MTSSLTHTTVATPVGPFTMVFRSHDDVLLASGFSSEIDRIRELLPIATRNASLQALPHSRLGKRVQQYFDGDVTSLDDIVVAQEETPFVASARLAMRSIPPGETLTYAQLAEQAGNSRASRAAGTACASNRITLIVPCHRIIRSGGNVGNYLWGPATKSWLLTHEKINSLATN